MIIVIDGPAGSGKSSTAKAVADRLNIQYLDSGALYRALTVLFLESGRDRITFFKLLDQKTISFHYKNEMFHVFIGDQELTDQLRSVKVNEYVSKVAAMEQARQRVNELMEEAIQQDVWIAEGRDLGTAVFPNAELKFFMIADLDTRTERRYKELKAGGSEVSKAEVKENLLDRDRRDSERTNDPLKKANDAIEVDTTNMTFEQQVDFICSTITDKFEIQT